MLQWPAFFTPLLTVSRTLLHISITLYCIYTIVIIILIFNYIISNIIINVHHVR